MLTSLSAFSQDKEKYQGIYAYGAETGVTYDTLRIIKTSDQVFLANNSWDRLEGSESVKVKESFVLYHPTYNYVYVTFSKWDDKPVLSWHGEGYVRLNKGIGVVSVE